MDKTKLQKEKNRVKWIDIAKGIGILLVLFSHVITSYVRQANNNDLLTSLPVQTVGSFFMPLFFYLSGIFISSNLKRSFAKVFKRKFCRLMVPYFSWGIVSVVFWSLYSHKSPIPRILELPIRPIFVLWFVYSMFLSTLVFWIFQKYFSRNVILVVSVILYIIGYGIGGNIDVDSFIKPIVGVLQNFIFVYFGFLTNDLVMKNRKKSSLYLFFLVSIFLLISFNVSLKLISSNDYFLRMIIRFLCAVLGIISTCEFSRILASWSFKRDMLSVLGFYSMEIYLIHKIVVEVLSIAISRVSLNAIVFTSANILITLVICYFVIKIIDQLKLKRVFFGF